MLERVAILVGRHQEGAVEDPGRLAALEADELQEGVAQRPVAHRMRQDVQPPGALLQVARVRHLAALAGGEQRRVVGVAHLHEEFDQPLERPAHGEARGLCVLAVREIAPGRLHHAVRRPGEQHHEHVLLGAAVHLLQRRCPGHRVLEAVGEAVQVDYDVAVLGLEKVAQVVEHLARAELLAGVLGPRGVERLRIEPSCAYAPGVVVRRVARQRDLGQADAEALRPATVETLAEDVALGRGLVLHIAVAGEVDLGHAVPPPTIR